MKKLVGGGLTLLLPPKHTTKGCMSITLPPSTTPTTASSTSRWSRSNDLDERVVHDCGLTPSFWAFVRIFAWQLNFAIKPNPAIPGLRYIYIYIYIYINIFIYIFIFSFYDNRVISLLKNYSMNLSLFSSLLLLMRNWFSDVPHALKSMSQSLFTQELCL